MTVGLLFVLSVHPVGRLKMYPREIQVIKNDLNAIEYKPSSESFMQLINICVELCDHLDAMQGQINQSANTASCLANGIIPD